MPTVTATQARSKLYRLIDDIVDSHQPVTITRKRGNVVLVSEEDWQAVQGMRKSIRDGLSTPVDECKQDIEW